jgi:hypothetical protein
MALNRCSLGNNLHRVLVFQFSTQVLLRNLWSLDNSKPKPQSLDSSKPKLQPLVNLPSQLFQQVRLQLPLSSRWLLILQLRHQHKARFKPNFSLSQVLIATNKSGSSKNRKSTMICWKLVASAIQTIPKICFCPSRLTNTQTILKFVKEMSTSNGTLTP